ncbi:NAD(P)/FAD-dependent oxidoreductase [Nicoliella spurrieriana]|uniref:Ferredoxin--NADP reductase n=1 Tax=Nicoliella spurrieriana TaxID=2925830 RepID=A0A976RSL9_9LACO|nr:NAD(P)/FAD-dependent oxidoreductase [Nicoliella spurrieriana]UQS87147.1 NAD(P)/FAD-dependent oxidoreductase [Nicoliella spurrieriana]
MQDNLYDITIIGGGPVGMFAGFYAGLRNLRVQLIESLPELGGQLNAIYPEKTILDVAGFTGVTGKQLVERLADQLATMDVDVKLGQAVTNLVKGPDAFKIQTTHETSASKTVLIATGGGSFEPRKLAVDNVEQFEHQHIVYSVQNLADFKGKTVIVAGGGNSAVDNALLLSDVAKQVYLIHRRDEFRGMEHMVDQLRASAVKVVTPYLIKKISAQADQVLVTAKKMRTEAETIEIVADKILVNYGFISSNKVSKGWELDLDESHHMFNVDTEMATSVAGVYAVGDSATYEGKDTLIATGFGEVPLAINQIANQLYPDRHLPIHSTALKR